MPVSPEHEALHVAVMALKAVIEQSKPRPEREIEQELADDMERRHAGDRRFS